MTADFDAVVIGAGIVGCACARECALAGMRVAIVERELPGGAATAAAMGHVVAMDDSPAQLALTGYGRSLWQELAPVLPRPLEYEGCGTLWIAANDEELVEVHTKQATYAAAGIASEILDETQLALREPNLRGGLAGALLVPGDAVIYPPTAATFLLAEAEQHGAFYYRLKNVVASDTGTVAFADGTKLKSRVVILATGADTSLLPGAPIQKRKGHLLITDRYPGFVRHQLVELGYLKSAHATTADSVAFNIQPRRTGQLLIGSSRQYGNTDPVAEAAIVQAMLARALTYMPRLAQLSGLRLWTGFRAATPDKLPLIGPTDDPSVWLAMGFEGLGITTSLAAARILVDQLLHRTSAIAREPYAPGRINVRPQFETARETMHV